MTNTDTDADADAEEDRATQESWEDADNWHDTDEWNDPPLEDDDPTTTLLAHLGFGITLGAIAGFFIMVGIVVAGGAPVWMATIPIVAALFGFVLVGAGTDTGAQTDDRDYRGGD